MKPFVRQQFICSAIEQCKETVNCCFHKTPHIKDERCVPKQCRYAPGISNVDCDPFDPENPRAPVPVPVAPVKTVEQVMREKYVIAEPVKAETVKYEPGPVTKFTDEYFENEIPVPAKEPVITFVEAETVAIPEEDPLLKDMKEKEEKGKFVTLDEAAKELGIKEAVKKQATSKKKGRK